MPSQIEIFVFPDVHKYKNTWWYLAVFVFIVHIFSVTSILLAIAKEEEDAPVVLKNASKPNSTPYTTGENIFMNIPEDATNIEFFMELGEESPSTGLQYVLPESPGADSVKIKQEPAIINEPVRWVLSNSSNIVKYRTPPAHLIEEDNNETIKRVRVESNASIHYYNVTAFTNITETKKELIRLFWFDNRTRVDVTHNPAYNATFIDTDGNGLVNNVQWTVPMLSSQTFEIGITILNVQSYPMLGGNWIVRFNTNGISNLSITPINGTLFGRDLEFLGLWCGAAQVNATYNGTSVSYPEWNCSDEGKIINRPITPGKHTLEFVFGTVV